MPQTCSKCSRVNPDEAGYCYYDGSALDGQSADGGPIHTGSRAPQPVATPGTPAPSPSRWARLDSNEKDRVSPVFALRRARELPLLHDLPCRRSRGVPAWPRVSRGTGVRAPTGDPWRPPEMGSRAGTRRRWKSSLTETGSAATGRHRCGTRTDQPARLIDPPTVGRTSRAPGCARWRGGSRLRRLRESPRGLHPRLSSSCRSSPERRSPSS